MQPTAHRPISISPGIVTLFRVCAASPVTTHAVLYSSDFSTASLRHQVGTGSPPRRPPHRPTGSTCGHLTGLRRLHPVGRGKSRGRASAARREQEAPAAEGQASSRRELGRRGRRSRARHRSGGGPGRPRGSRTGGSEGGGSGGAAEPAAGRGPTRGAQGAGEASEVLGRGRGR